MRVAHVAVIMALSTRDEMSPRLDGHIEALRGERPKYLCQSVECFFLMIIFLISCEKCSHRPPIMMPNELKLANPQRA